MQFVNDPDRPMTHSAHCYGLNEGDNLSSVEQHSHVEILEEPYCYRFRERFS